MQLFTLSSNNKKTELTKEIFENFDTYKGGVDKNGLYLILTDNVKGKANLKVITDLPTFDENLFFDTCKNLGIDVYYATFRMN